MDVDTRFWSKVEITDGCWLWTAGLIKGYGQFWFNGTTVYAHRWSYEQLVGPIPKGLELDHTCRVHRCVRPDHLEPVTHVENMRRGIPGRNNSQKTHCPRGHEYTKANTYRHNGRRFCRACKRVRG